MNFFWKTKDGKTMSISTMTESHIHNVVKCLQGKGKYTIPSPYIGLTRNVWLAVFQREIINRGQPLIFN